MVILLSTRGTAGSDIWFTCLADKPMVRRYHLRDYDWTPLSQNPVQKIATIPSAPRRRQATIYAAATDFGPRGGKATALRLLADADNASACRKRYQPHAM